MYIADANGYSQKSAGADHIPAVYMLFIILTGMHLWGRPGELL
jgi:hypothetical protein